MNHETAKYADGPMVAQWLTSKGVQPYSESLKKRLAQWRLGGTADIFALDRILVDTQYGLWELPDEVWLDIMRPRDLPTPARPHRPKQVFHQLKDAGWLRQRYEQDRLPAGPIAEEVGCHPHTVLAALRRHGIEIRTRGGNQSGEKVAA